MKSLVVVALIAITFAIAVAGDKLCEPPCVDPCDEKTTIEKWEGAIKCAKEGLNYEESTKKAAACLKKANGDKDIDPQFDKFKETMCKDDKKVQKETMKCIYPPDGKLPPLDKKTEECLQKIH